MDEKTEQLRDIFMDVAEEETVTETQEETPGSLTGDDDVDQQLRSTIADMRDKCGFGTTLSDEELVTVVKGFYAGESDTDIARALGDDSLSKTVSRARLDLHLLRESDTDAPFDLDELRTALQDDRSVSDVADDVDASESTVRRYRRVLETQREIRRVNDRYRNDFENVLEDRELSDQMTDDATGSGLEDATEGQEVDVSF